MMNLSGRAVGGLRRAYHVSSLADLLVVHDDMDISLGTVRLRERGGSGGHRGMQSIIESVGGQDFARLRVGIGRPRVGQDPIDYVLTRFSSDEEAAIDRAVRVAADAAQCWIQYGATETMNRFNAGGGL
jgi:PTH1 family peptidyl-tRNA hydrolase